MDLVVDRWLRLKRGYSFSSGKYCDCDDRYRKTYSSGTVTIQHSACNNGKKAKSCPVMFTYYKSGELVKQVPVPRTAALFNDLLKELELIPSDLGISQAG